MTQRSIWWRAKLLCVLLLPGLSFADMEMGMYVAVSNLERSGEFYAKVFKTEPYVKTPTFMGFYINGGRFGVLLESAYGVPLKRGNSAVPNILVTDIKKEHRRIKKLKPKFLQEKVADLGDIRMFSFVDYDGNAVEFFSIK